MALVRAGDLLARFTSVDPDQWSRPWPRTTHLGYIGDVEFHAAWRILVTAEALRTQVDGALAVPTLLWLRRTGLLDAPTGPAARLLSVLGLLDRDGWTTQGRALLGFVDHLGMVGSYLPMLSRLEELFDGSLVVNPGAGEWHCERRLNVQASAAAHRRYFCDADPVFAEILDSPRPPLTALASPYGVVLSAKAMLVALLLGVARHTRERVRSSERGLVRTRGPRHGAVALVSAPARSPRIHEVPGLSLALRVELLAATAVIAVAGLLAAVGR